MCLFFKLPQVRLLRKFLGMLAVVFMIRFFTLMMLTGGPMGERETTFLHTPDTDGGRSGFGGNDGGGINGGGAIGGINGGMNGGINGGIKGGINGGIKGGINSGINGGINGGINDGNDNEAEEAFEAVAKLAQTTCPNSRRPTEIKFRNDVWQTVTNSTQEIHVYSAFFDERPAVGTLPAVRLLSVATPPPGPLYCQLWYDGIDSPLVVDLEVMSSGRGDTIRGIKYGQYQFTCRLPSVHPAPTHVSVSPAPCRTVPMLVPVRRAVRGTYRHEFGVCVAIAFGSPKWNQIVEWIELTRLQGVAEINVYNGSMDSSLRPLFQYYQTLGVLHLHQMPPPQNDYSKRGAKLGSPASLNDCMLRYMYRYKYIVVVDFDEVIVPRKDANYHDMLQRIDLELKLPEPWLSYTFRNLYFFTDHSPKPGNEDTTMLRYRMRNKDPSKYLFAPKSFIDPRRCESVFNHYCYVRFKNSHTPAKWTIDVSPDIAMSHHYRNCGLKKTECETMLSEGVQDDVMLRFNVSLSTRMSKVFRDLNYDPKK